MLTQLSPLFITLVTLAPQADDPAPFARWEKEIAAIEERDRKDPPPANPVVFVGSSTIRLWDVKKSFPGVLAVNHGFGGSQIADATHFAPRLVLKLKPRLVVFYSGDNDLALGKTPERIAADLREFVKVVRAELPEVPIVVLSIKPSVARWAIVDKQRQANKLIEEFCKGGERLMFVDVGKGLLGDDGKPRAELFVKDGLHLSAKGYELWAGVLKDIVK
jgi:lysophospholipase L1-like esterase